MKPTSKTIATALIAGAFAVAMQSAEAFFLSPHGYCNFGPWNMSRFGMRNRGGAPYGGFPFQSHGMTYHHPTIPVPVNFHGHAPYHPAAPAQSPAK
uniref:Uncharacterized protein n=1 Tax=Candidatus Kentrum sp. SD TaxID=2126332 RepID=A0A451BQ16_9GAMM|nr:MAG: hypothetical protein BECKSD772D_GA0070982_11077 [Candidatus Kentron sp. SD]